MKKNILFLLVFGICFFQYEISSAQKISYKDLVLAEKAELNGSEWVIFIKQVGEDTGNAETDILSFSDNKVTSANMRKMGFEGTPFSVTVKEDETVIWETMQSGNGQTAFWRGDIKNGIMNGMLSKKSASGESTNFFFNSNQN